MTTSIADQVIEQLNIMPQDLQYQVLEFARSLTNSKIKGVPGKELLRFAGSTPKEDLQLISEAIKQDCEKVDFDRIVDTYSSHSSVFYVVRF
ncbi:MULTISPECIES: hypothetical protein [Aphanizomenonaceae]|jgi:hypothetical protein|uniref:hypothetical protein n=1 Tax=Aphanizomenonaceae TaxID=1892259 RepID=UPI0014457765|nr:MULTISPECIES: hypothetical protein [Aphanizomenonaceae]MBO1068225.1 hypothetical protein [Dolichospermum sp. DEX189]MTJ30526.1 hypothetical protein [Aphanizomenon sp. UHCC 0183]MTJ48683.1 hypothetical protein [Dolichospermum sp. UHCC 0259]